MKLVEILTEFDPFSVITPYNININNYNLRQTIFPLETSTIDINNRKSFYTGKTLRNIRTVETIREKKVYDIYCKITYYRMVFAYYLIKIIMRLIEKSQQIKIYIFSLISIKKLIKFIFELDPPFSEKQILSIIKSENYRKTKLFLKIEFYFKMKYIGCVLIFHLLNLSKDKKRWLSLQLIENGEKAFDLAFSNEDDIVKISKSFNILYTPFIFDFRVCSLTVT